VVQKGAMIKRLFVFAATCAALFAPVAGFSVETERWDLETFEQWSKGEASGVEISSRGELRPVGKQETFEVPADGVWSIAGAGMNRFFLGTGNKAQLFEFERGKVRELLALDDKVAISKVAAGPSGDIWFAAMPGGVIYRLDSGKAVEIVQTGQDYVWDMIFLAGDLVAATGPQGKIMVISPSGKLKRTIETGEDHVLCLLEGGDRRLYAGTSGEGLVLEIQRDGYKVVHDFKEQEVKSLAWAGKGEAGTLVAAVNSESRGTAVGRPSPRIMGKDKKNHGNGHEGGDEEKSVETQLMIEAGPAPRGAGKVSSAVYSLTPEGGARLLVELPNRAAVDLAVSGSDVYAATDQGGKVYRMRPDSTVYAISFDLPQAQALSLLVEDKGEVWIGTGSPAALVKVERKPFGKPEYVSEVLDAQFPARWGAIEWDHGGGPLRVLTRSGNIKDPERGWSGWKPVGMGVPAQVQSPDARYLQVKVQWPLNSKAVLKSLSVPYLVYNQPHFVDLVKVESNEQDGDEKKSSRKRGSEKNSEGPGKHETERDITWKVTNPDDDELSFQLYFQPEGTSRWIKVDTKEPVTKNKFKWETRSIPDGWYRIKVVATDAPSNPPEKAIRAENVSEKILVDNRAPQIKGLAVTRGKVGGKAVDETSAVSGIQFAVDGGEWIAVAAEDGVLDSKRESFEFELPDELERGPHVIAVRAWDRAYNVGIGMTRFEY